MRQALNILPDVYLEAIGDKELNGVNMSTQMQRRVSLIIGG